MPLLNGCNHIALVTEDIDRFVAFYKDIFDGTVIDDMTEGPLRHVLLDIGGVVLHPFQLAEASSHEHGSDEMFARGHIDHFGLDVADPAVFEELRRRLVEAGASDGMVTDFGITRNVWFEDPDGMGCEIVMWAGASMLSFDDRIQETYDPQPVG